MMKMSRFITDTAVLQGGKLMPMSADRYDDTFLTAEEPCRLLKAEGRLRIPALHIHDSLEINVVTGGRGVNYIGGREYLLAPGQVYLISNLEPHIAISDGSLQMDILLFSSGFVWQGNPENYDYLRPFYRTEPDHNRLELPPHALERLSGILGELERELAGRQPDYRLFLRAKLLELLAVICRRCPGEDGPTQSARLRDGYRRIRPSADYMATHFSEPLTLEEIAGRSNMSRTYFSGLFKQVMGIGVARYLESIRLSNACLLLTTTGRSVTDIALACGYGGLSAFHPAFKKAYGKTPVEYRRHPVLSGNVQQSGRNQ